MEARSGSNTGPTPSPRLSEPPSPLTSSGANESAPKEAQPDGFTEYEKTAKN